MNIFTTDVLVIGAGGAAARAAVEAASSNVRVDLVDKGEFGHSGTSVPCLQGFASTLNNEDNPEIFFNDWLRSSERICDQNLVWAAITKSRKAVESLEAMGLKFIGNEDGGRLFYRGAGHSVARGMTAKDHMSAGPNVVTILRAEAEKRGVYIHEGIMITRLLQKEGRVIGAAGITSKKEFIIFRAKAVILAAGGANKIFPNTAGEAAKPLFRTTGDSYNLSFGAGALLIDMEFTQFRESPPGAAKFGGRYLNTLEERFMEKYDPVYLEKAPRAKVVGAIYREMMAGRSPIRWEVGGIPKEEASYVEWVRNSAAQKYIQVGIDFQRVLGGARINEKAETTVPGLFAAGESSGGVQGAGRMQGAAYLETQVFGTIAGENASALALHSELEEISLEQVHDEEKRIENIKGNLDPEGVTRNIQKIMWEQVGVVRSRESLESALDKFEQIRNEVIPELAGENIFAVLESINLLFTAEIITRSALSREESRGAQIRLDFPDINDDQWLKHICIANKGGSPDIRTLPIITR